MGGGNPEQAARERAQQEYAAEMRAQQRQLQARKEAEKAQRRRGGGGGGGRAEAVASMASHPPQPTGSMAQRNPSAEGHQVRECGAMAVTWSTVGRCRVDAV